MASRKFRFVSPGVFLKEIDNSQLPGVAPAIGPVIIGRTRQGPAMKPYKVRSLEEFDRVFGAPMPGNEGSDPWREGTDLLAESYAPYAARAYLSAEIDSPVTIVRLAGIAGDDALDGTDGEPGWKAEKAFGLFLYTSASAGTHTGSAKLEPAAIFYSMDDGLNFKLKGKSVKTAASITAEHGQSVTLSDTNRLTMQIVSGSDSKEVSFLLSEIRNELNTNPVATNSEIMNPAASSMASKYWLGETFEEAIAQAEASVGDSDKVAAVVLELDSEMADFKSEKHGLTAARTGWFIPNDAAMNNSTFAASKQDPLFRLVAIQEGSEAGRNLIIAIEEIKIPRAKDLNRFGSFSVVVKRISNSKVEVVERFDNCNLDANSDNFVARKIGDQYYEWNSNEKRNKLYGTSPNVSEYIRVELHPDLDPAGVPEKVPFGFLGPIRPVSLTGEPAGGVAAAGKVTFSSAPADGAIIQITNHAGTSESFRIMTGNTDVDGSRDAGTGMIKVGVGGSATPISAAAALRSAINAYVAAAGNTITVSAGGSNAEVTITQGVVGSAGNKTAGNGDISLGGSHNATVVQFAGGSDHGTHGFGSGTEVWVSGTLDKTHSDLSGSTCTWPDFPLIVTGSADDDYLMGATPYLRRYGANGATTVTPALNPGYVDHVRRLSSLDSLSLVGDQDDGTATTGQNEHVFAFSLDEVVLVPTAAAAGAATGAAATSSISRESEVKSAYYAAGSKAASVAAQSFSGIIADTGGKADGLRVLTEIIKGFQAPLVGGSDGTNIREANPFNNRVLEENSSDTSYSFASVDRAIELVKDPEMIEHNLAVLPGITNEILTTKLVRACESRADSMAIIDLPEVYVPPSQKRCAQFSNRIKTTPAAAADRLVSRQLNSSYGAAYYPWVKIRDEMSSRDVWVPPSVVALGVMAYTEERDAVWFAPAGFNRGGLNEGNSGVPVLQVSEQLMAKDRDTLYEANVNPIASFVSEGIVIFGQKTLQSTQSALDRINVRRLLIYVKKFVSTVCSNLLFEQNVQETWNRFVNAVVPELESIKQKFGLSDFKVILDDTTTTADLVDRNIMYAKIFLKPARSIEFIAVDFIISRSGAEFADPLG